MQIKINLDEFWIDEESELEPALKQHVISCCVVDIKKNIEEKVNKEITSQVTEMINTKVEGIIDRMLTECIDNETIIRNREEVKIVDYIKELFQQHNGWNRPADQIASIAKKFGNELKAQYNMAFANHIVMNLKEQGMLNENVAKMLTEQK